MAIEIMLCFLNPGLLYFFHIIRAVSNDGIILRVAEDKFMITEGIWDPCLSDPGIQIQYSFLVNCPWSLYTETDAVLRLFFPV